MSECASFRAVPPLISGSFDRFEYFADSLGYGLTVNTTSMDGPITTNSQFGLLAAQYRAVTPPVSTNSTAVASVYPS